MFYGNICPPIPRRYSNALADFVNAVDSAALVAARDNEVAVHNVNQIRFPLSAHLADVDFFLFYKSVNYSAFANCSGDNHRRIAVRQVIIVYNF